MDTLSLTVEVKIYNGEKTISLTTGSGKTVVFELAITRLLMEVPLPWSNIKIVYSKYLYIEKVIINHNNENPLR